MLTSHIFGGFPSLLGLYYIRRDLCDYFLGLGTYVSVILFIRQFLIGCTCHLEPEEITSNLYAQIEEITAQEWVDQTHTHKQ